MNDDQESAVGEPELMECPSCLAVVDSSARFCPYCRRDFGWPARVGTSTWGAKHAGAIVAILVIGAGLDWTFSFGPVTELAVYRCANRLEGHDPDGPAQTRPIGGYLLGGSPNGDYHYGDADPYTRDSAKHTCRNAKVKGRMRLDGGGNF